MAKKPFSFAHLLGRGASASEEEEDKKAKKAKARSAEEGEEEEEAEEEQEEEASEQEEESAEEEEDEAEDGDEDRNESKAARSARIAERKRCARIFGCQHAAANPALAASLAFNTGMRSSAAIDVLASTASQPQATGRRTLDQRMQESHDVRLGQDGEKNGGKSALVSRMTRLYNATRGAK